MDTRQDSNLLSSLKRRQLSRNVNLPHKKRAKLGQSSCPSHHSKLRCSSMANHETTTSFTATASWSSSPSSSPSPVKTEKATSTTSKKSSQPAAPERLERKREINRLSAQRKRVRERELLDNLSEKYAELSSLNKALKTDNASLELILEKLKEEAKSDTSSTTTTKTKTDDQDLSQASKQKISTFEAILSSVLPAKIIPWNPPAPSAPSAIETTTSIRCIPTPCQQTPIDLQQQQVNEMILAAHLSNGNQSNNMPTVCSPSQVISAGSPTSPFSSSVSTDPNMTAVVMAALMQSTSQQAQQQQQQALAITQLQQLASTSISSQVASNNNVALAPERQKVLIALLQAGGEAAATKRSYPVPPPPPETPQQQVTEAATRGPLTSDEKQTAELLVHLSQMGAGADQRVETVRGPTASSNETPKESNGATAKTAQDADNSAMLMQQVLSAILQQQKMNTPVNPVQTLSPAAINNGSSLPKLPFQPPAAPEGFIGAGLNSLMAFLSSSTFCQQQQQQLPSMVRQLQQPQLPSRLASFSSCPILPCGMTPQLIQSRPQLHRQQPPLILQNSPPPVPSQLLSQAHDTKSKTM